MFFFQKVWFSQHFPPQILFFVFDFCAIFAAISPNFFHAGIFLRNQTWGICTTPSPKMEWTRGVWANDFDRICYLKNWCFRRISWVFIAYQKNNFGPQLPYSLSKTCFFCSQNRLSFYFFWKKKFIYRKKCCFRSQNWYPKSTFTLFFLK